jgi:hypothetical protein
MIVSGDDSEFDIVNVLDMGTINEDLVLLI